MQGWGHEKKPNKLLKYFQYSIDNFRKKLGRKNKNEEILITVEEVYEKLKKKMNLNEQMLANDKEC